MPPSSKTKQRQSIGLDDLAIVCSLPGHYSRDNAWSAQGSATAAQRQTLVGPARLGINVNDEGHSLDVQPMLPLGDAASWDDVSGTDWREAANRAGLDFYYFAVLDGGSLRLVLSPNSTIPEGYDADTSRKVGGFHCLCANVGVISGHPLSGFLAGDILPMSVWDLLNRPRCSPEGMVWSEAAGVWVDIYPQSGTGASAESVFGGTVVVSRTWMDHVADLGAASKRLLGDGEFQLVAFGSNERTNIAGGAAPGTAGGHSDTAGRRMLSHAGCEDCCGVYRQWLVDQTYYLGGADYAAAKVDGINGNANRGAIRYQGTQSNAKVTAGGHYNDTYEAGSYARANSTAKYSTLSYITGRGCCPPRLAA